MDQSTGFVFNHLCAFIRSFFLLVDAILVIDENNLFSVFSIPNSRNSFFIECFIPASENGFSAQCLFIQSKFCASGNHYSNQGEAIFYSNFSPTIGNHVLRAFVDIPGGERSFSAQWKRILLTNPSFQLVESEFLSIGNSILLFTVFYWL